MKKGLPVITTLYCLPQVNESSGEGGNEGESFQMHLERLLPLLNFSSTCYLITRGVPGESNLIDDTLKTIHVFIQENAFLQLTLRPVHPFNLSHSRSWISAYQQFLQVCRPFQQEAYREQIVSRLRIFPVIFFPEALGVEAALPFLDFLKKNFFLPSILLPKDKADEIETLNASELGQRWERIYLTDTGVFSPAKIGDTLMAHQIFDDLLSDDSGSLFSSDGFCQGNLILDGQGTLRACSKKDGKHFPLGSELTPTITIETGEVPVLVCNKDYVACIDCLLPMMDQGGRQFRLNQQGQAWEEICDRIGGRLLKEGLYNIALKIWAAAMQGLDENEVPIRFRVKKAMCHYEKADLDASMAELKIARQVAPERAEVPYYMGLCEFGWRDYIESADRFAEALALGLDSPMKQEAEFFRGLSHYHLEEFDEALPALKKARQAGKQDSSLFFYQGLCRLGKEEYALAISEFQEALVRGPAADDLFHVLFYLAHTYKEMEDYQKAVEFCEQALEQNPLSKDVYNLIGFCYFKQGEYEAAISCFEKVLEIDPRSAIDYANIGSNLRELGKMEDALEIYKKALALDPSIDFAIENVKIIEETLKKDLP